MKGKVDVVLGLQWGDEGKGKIVDFLAPDYDIIARFQGGPNAGHTLETGTTKIVTNTIPSGVLSGKINFIGAGVVIDPFGLKKEVTKIEEYQPDWRNKILIAGEAHLILPVNKMLDGVYDELLGLGTTRKGIGPTYANQSLRINPRVWDISKSNFKERVESITKFFQEKFGFKEVDNSEFFEACEWLKNSFKIVSSTIFINEQLKNGKKILAEGAQGTLLDINYGTYPFVTSSSCSTGGVMTGLGIGPQCIDRVYGVFKAYVTRVGEGPMPGLITGETRDLICKIGAEVGATTGRPRRPASLDLVALMYAIELNGVTDLIMTKGDVLDDIPSKMITSYKIGHEKTYDFVSDADMLKDIQVNETCFPPWKGLKDAKSQKDLPIEFQRFIRSINEHMSVEIKIISNGPKRNQTICL